MIGCFPGQLHDTATIKGLTGKLNVDNGNRIYNLDAKIQVDTTKDRVTYTPVITLEIPDWKNIQVSGVMNVVIKRVFESFESQLQITGFTTDPINFEGK